MGNIFDEAGRSSKGKTKPAPAQKKNPTSTDATKYTQANAEIDNMFQRINEMKHDIDHQVKILYEEGARRNINVDSFLKHMPPQPSLTTEYDKIKEIEKQLSSDIMKQIPIKSSSPAKSADKLSQERKSKTRGSRQKWIPMS